MKRILLLIDMEGCCGIYDMSDYKDCKLKMEIETEYIINTLHRMGYNNVDVLDCHNDGNTLMNLCHERDVKFYNHIWSLTDAEQYSYAFLIGFHSKNGVEGYFSHTIRPDIDKLFLGNKCIGEVELLINWMAFYNIPVVYISGDKSLMQELENYEGEFVPTKCLGDNKLVLDNIKKNIYLHIERALSQNVKIQYIDSSIRVKLVGVNYLKCIPQELFKVDNGYITFKDTLDFISRLKLLCDFLNLSNIYQDKRINIMVKMLKQCHNNLCNDAKANELINIRDWRTLTDEELVYLSNCCKNI